MSTQIVVWTPSEELRVELKPGQQVAHLKEVLHGHSPSVAKLRGDFYLALEGSELPDSVALHVKALTLELLRDGEGRSGNAAVGAGGSSAGVHASATQAPTPTSASPSKSAKALGGDASSPSPRQSTEVKAAAKKTRGGNASSSPRRSIEGAAKTACSASSAAAAETIRGGAGSSSPARRGSESTSKTARAANSAADAKWCRQPDRLPGGADGETLICDSWTQDLQLYDRVQVRSRTAGGQWADAVVVGLQTGGLDMSSPVVVYLEYSVGALHCRKTLDINSPDLRIPPPHLRCLSPTNHMQVADRSSFRGPIASSAEKGLRNSVLASAAAEAVAVVAAKGDAPANGGPPEKTGAALECRHTALHAEADAVAEAAGRGALFWAIQATVAEAGGGRNVATLPRKRSAAPAAAATSAMGEAAETTKLPVPSAATLPASFGSSHPAATRGSHLQVPCTGASLQGRRSGIVEGAAQPASAGHRPERWRRAGSELLDKLEVRRFKTEGGLATDTTPKSSAVSPGGANRDHFS